jgi:hypothetical protein
LAVEKPSAAVSAGLMGARDPAGGGEANPVPRRKAIFAREIRGAEAHLKRSSTKAAKSPCGSCWPSEIRWLRVFMARSARSDEAFRKFATARDPDRMAESDAIARHRAIGQLAVSPNPPKADQSGFNP